MDPLLLFTSISETPCPCGVEIGSVAVPQTVQHVRDYIFFPVKAKGEKQRMSRTADYRLLIPIY